MERHPADCTLCNAPGLTVHYYAPPEAKPYVHTGFEAGAL